MVLLVLCVVLYAAVGGFLFLFIESGTQLEQLRRVRTSNQAKRLELLTNINATLQSPTNNQQHGQLLTCNHECLKQLLAHIDHYDRHTGVLNREHVRYYTHVVYLC